jgi:hypothetical protein
MNQMFEQQQAMQKQLYELSTYKVNPSGKGLVRPKSFDKLS